MDKKLCKKKSKNNIMRIVGKIEERKRLYKKNNIIVQSNEKAKYKVLQRNEYKKHIKEKT